MPSSGRGKFALISQPQALPDDDDTPPARPRQTQQGRDQAAQPTQAESEQVTEPPTSPAVSPAPAATRAAATKSAGKVEQEAPVMARAATTVRLRPSAAEPLNAAWLDERRHNDPKLSYPEFASRIVSLGLAAYKKQKTR